MDTQGSAPSPQGSIAETIVSQQTTSAASPAAPQTAPVVEPKVEAKKPEDDFSKKFAALSRKERQIQEQTQRLKLESAEVERAKRIRELAKTDPIKYLEESGLTLNELLERAAKHGEEPTADDRLKALQDKLEALEKERLDAKKSEEQKKNQEVEEKAISHFKNEIKVKLEANAERFETILKTDSMDEVFNLCELWYQEKGEILEIEEAAQMVEDQLLSYAEKFASVSKFAQKLKPKVEEPAALAQEPTRLDPPAEHQTPLAPPTLNSKTTPEPSAQTSRLSKEESLKRAAALIRWT